METNIYIYIYIYLNMLKHVFGCFSCHYLSICQFGRVFEGLGNNKSGLNVFYCQGF